MKPSDYPTGRSPAFRDYFLKVLLRSGAIKDLGRKGSMLLLNVLLAEQSRRFTSPPTFMLCQLAEKIGVRRSEISSLVRYANKSGWLQRRDGLVDVFAKSYWVSIPEVFEQRFGSSPGQKCSRDFAESS